MGGFGLIVSGSVRKWASPAGAHLCGPPGVQSRRVLGRVKGQVLAMLENRPAPIFCAWLRSRRARRCAAPLTRPALPAMLTAGRLQGMVLSVSPRNGRLGATNVPSRLSQASFCADGSLLVAASTATAVDCGLGQEAKEPAACRIEGALLGFGLTVGEQRATIVADMIENDLLDRHSPQVAVHLQAADHLAAKCPDVVAVPPQGRARQWLGQ